MNSAMYAECAADLGSMCGPAVRAELLDPCRTAASVRSALRRAREQRQQLLDKAARIERAVYCMEGCLIAGLEADR